QFRNICKLAVNYYKNLHHNEKECHELVTQLIKYKARVASWDLEYSSDLTPSTWWGVVEDERMHLQELAETMFAIALSQASCKRNFSILKWFSEGRRTQLQVSRLESLVQIHSFYVSNIMKELKFCGNNSVEAELRNSVLNETVFAEIDNIEINEDEERDEIEVTDPQ
ncbi:6174_t:CDS:1, partial [Gigaspora rosea]